MKVYLVFLAYDIMFNDSDEGECWAADGKYDLKLFDSEEKAQNFISKYKDTVEKASKECEKQVFPLLPNQKILVDSLGIGMFDLSEMTNVQLNYKVLKVE